MHYKNGREAHNGDRVVWVSGSGTLNVKIVDGVLYDAVAGNDFCNGKLAPTGPNDPCPNLKECLRLDDFNDMMEKDAKLRAEYDALVKTDKAAVDAAAKQGFKS